jgi:hypothetical protein
VTRLPGGVTGSIGGTAVAVVQQESTATGLDAGGPQRTREDGDLRLYTRVDGLPLDGMQESGVRIPIAPQIRSLNRKPEQSL